MSPAAVGTEIPFAKASYADVVLVLAAHGSTRRPDANATIERHAQKMRNDGPFANVVTTFLIGEEPSRSFLNCITGEIILIVPFMMSEGYLAQEIAKQVQDAAQSRLQPLHNAPKVLVSAAVGTHEGVARIAARKARKELALHGCNEKSANVIVVAHGSKGSPESKQAGLAQSERLRQMDLFGNVTLAMLEEPPMLADVLSQTDGPSAIVGLFAAPGGHAIDDVRMAIAESGRSDLYDAGPVGIDDAMTEIAVLRAIQTLQKYS